MFIFHEQLEKGWRWLGYPSEKIFVSLPLLIKTSRWHSEKEAQLDTCKAFNCLSVHNDMLLCYRLFIFGLWIDKIAVYFLFCVLYGESFRFVTHNKLHILRLAKHRHIQYNKYLRLNSRSLFFHFPKRKSRKKF